MDKYLKMWEPVLKSFEGNYEAMQLKGNDARKLKKEEELKEVTEYVVDWYPSGYLEITVTMSDGKIYLYDFINNGNERMEPLNWMKTHRQNLRRR